MLHQLTSLLTINLSTIFSVKPIKVMGNFDEAKGVRITTQTGITEDITDNSFRMLVEELKTNEGVSEETRTLLAEIPSHVDDIEAFNEALEDSEEFFLGAAVIATRALHELINHHNP